MTDVELKDYIAIQAMSAMLHNESMASSHAMENMKDPDDTNTRDFLLELAHASFHIAETMMDVRAQREDPKFLDKFREEYQASMEIKDEDAK